jgi:hypothetical protein
MAEVIEIWQKMDGPGNVLHPDGGKVTFIAGPPEVVDAQTLQVEYGPACFETADPKWIQLFERFPEIYRKIGERRDGVKVMLFEPKRGPREPSNPGPPPEDA